MAKYGCDPEALKIMSGIWSVIGRTQEEVREKLSKLAAMDSGGEVTHRSLGMGFAFRADGGPYPWMERTQERSGRGAAARAADPT
jgi:hypothetical protein